MENKKEPHKPEKISKPKIGITMGDFNGIGPEIIIKVLQDTRIAAFCTPIIYGSGKVLTRYRRILNMDDFAYHQYNANSFLHEKRPNVVNCWNENIEVEPGKMTELAGECAYLALQKSTQDLKAGFLDAVVTAPINKANIQREAFKFAGHTDYYEHEFGGENTKTLMLLCSNAMKVGVITAHIPLEKVKEQITSERIREKITILNRSLKQDFGIQKPKIAVLGLNPHAGEAGLLGDEEKNIIHPTLEKLREEGIMAMGTYPADGFFGTMQFRDFDAVLACYHDQGLIPFKTICFNSGVNFTAGLSIVRTSPDHGTAYDIAGKGIADENSMREAIYMAVDIVKQRQNKIERQLRVTKKLTREKM